MRILREAADDIMSLEDWLSEDNVDYEDNADDVDGSELIEVYLDWDTDMDLNSTEKKIDSILDQFIDDDVIVTHIIERPVSNVEYAVTIAGSFDDVRYWMRENYGADSENLYLMHIGRKLNAMPEKYVRPKSPAELILDKLTEEEIKILRDYFKNEL